MAILNFPPVDQATPEGILGIGGDLDIETLKAAYRNGIFPWPTEDFPLLWFAPPERAVLEFQDLKIPRRLRQELKSKKFHFKVDHDFPSVIRACAEGATRKTQGTWITPEMIQAYIDFHRAGHAHSFETYDLHGTLVGGLYGVSFGGMFAGESMFYLKGGASKAALLFAVEFLKERGATWMDVQMLTPLLKNLGAREIPREEFMSKLTEALKKPPLFPSEKQSV